MTLPTYLGSLGQTNPYVSVDTVFGFEPTSASPNRLVDQTLFAVQFLRLKGGKLVRFLPALGDPWPNAAEIDFTALVPSITATDPYSVQPLGAGSRSREYTLAEIGGTWQLANIEADEFSDQRNQVADQTAGKQRAVRTRFGQLFIGGNAAIAGQFDGLIQLIAQGYGQSFAASLTNPLDELRKMVGLLFSNDRDRREIVFLMNTDALNVIESLIGLKSDPEQAYRECPLLGGALNLYQCGCPILISDHIETDTQTGLTTIFAFNRKQLLGLAGEKNFDITTVKVESPTLTAHNFLTSWRVCIASLTGLGLVSCTNFPAVVA
ncbi:MAG: hypothetical protein AB7K09_11100 [Planctomycetota bacterium]